VIMNQNTLDAMLTNGDLYTADNGNGTRKNFDLDTSDQTEKRFVKYGRIIDPLLMIDVIVDTGDEEGNFVFDDGMVVATRPKILRGLFGGISIPIYKSGRLAGGEIDIKEWSWHTYHQTDPFSFGVIYKSAPMYAPRSQKGIAVLKAY